MSIKIATEKFESFILECINKMEIGEKVEFSQVEREEFTKKGKPFSKAHKITLTKVDDDRFTVIDRGNEDLEYSNIDFNEVIKELMKLKEEEFGDCEHFFAYRD
ncbi:MAG: hypothetical protein ACRCVL_00965 [Cetobacterium sp.]